MMTGSLDPIGGKIQTYLPKDETVEGDTHGPQVQCLSGCTGSVKLRHAMVTDLKTLTFISPLKLYLILPCATDTQKLSLRTTNITSLLVLCTTKVSAALKDILQR